MSYNHNTRVQLFRKYVYSKKFDLYVDELYTSIILRHHRHYYTEVKLVKCLMLKLKYVIHRNILQKMCRNRIIKYGLNCH